MLGHGYLAGLPEALVALYARVEADILADMARRISTYDYYIPSAEHQRRALREMGALEEDILRQLSRRTGRTEQELQRLMEAAERSLAYDEDLYRAQGLDPPALGASPELQKVLAAGLRQTQGLFRNLTRTTAHTASGQFEAALDRAWLQVSSGAFDYNTAIRTAIKDLCRQGVGAIRYPTGHVDTLETAVRRAVVTGVNQTMLKMQWELCDIMNCDLVETTAHPGARPDHAVWQGQVFSRSGESSRYPDFISSTGFGRGDGIGGWNCGHEFNPYFEGSPRSYTPEQLESYEARDIDYNGQKLTEYEATQRQRAMERSIRRWKRENRAMEAAGLDGSESAAKVRQWQEREKEFLRQTGLKRQAEREFVAPARKAGIMRTSGKPGDTDGYTVLDKVEKLPFSDKTAQRQRVERFCAEFADAPVEHTLVLSPDGHAYELTGMKGAVNPLVAGKDAVRGSVGVHNHPIPSGERMADSFSCEDVAFSARYGTSMEYLVSGTRRNAFCYTGSLGPEELAGAYRAAEQTVLERAFLGEIDLDTAWRQEEVMRTLAKRLEGFEFYETF